MAENKATLIVAIKDLASGALVKLSAGIALFQRGLQFAENLLKKAIDTTVGFAKELDRLSQQTGISAQTLAKLQFISNQANVSFEAVTLGLRNLGRQMVEAAGGAKQQQQAFASLGVAVTDSQGRLRDVSEVLLDVADRFASMPDGAKKSQVAFELFGRSGAELIPILNLGRAEIARLGEVAESLGVVLSDETIQQVKSFSDNLDILQGFVKGTTLAVGSKLVAALGDLTKAMILSAVVVRRLGRQFTDSLENTHPTILAIQDPFRQTFNAITRLSLKTTSLMIGHIENMKPKAEEVFSGILQEYRGLIKEIEKIDRENTHTTESEYTRRLAAARNSFDATASFHQAMAIRMVEDFKSVGTIAADIFTAIRDRFASSVADMILEGESFRVSMEKLGKDILRIFIEEVIKQMIARWVAAMILMDASSKRVSVPGQGGVGKGGVANAGGLSLLAADPVLMAAALGFFAGNEAGGGGIGAKAGGSSGALSGAALGFILGGPVGAFLGGAAGGALGGFIGGGLEDISGDIVDAFGFQKGGIVLPHPGGTLARIGEGGSPEAVIPLDSPRAQGMMGGTTININAGTIVADRYSAQQFAKMIDEELYRLRKQHLSVAFD